MKLWLLILLLAVLGSPVLRAEEAKPSLRLTIDSMTAEGLVKVGLHNETDKELRVWTGPYSWAFFNYRVLVVRNGEVRLYCGNPNEGFTMNVPAFETIKARGTLIHPLQLGSDKRDGSEPLGHQSGPKDTTPLLQKGDLVIVVYDVRWSMEANEKAVWTGITTVSKIY